MSNIRLFIIKLSSELNAVKRINRLSLSNLPFDQYKCRFVTSMLRSLL